MYNYNYISNYNYIYSNYNYTVVPDLQ